MTGWAAQQKCVLTRGACFIANDTQYDAKSRVAAVSNPYQPCLAESAQFTATTYDPLNRTLVVTGPDGTTTSRTYTGTSTRITSPGPIVKAVTTDALGRLTKVTEDPDNPATAYQTIYGYDVLDDLSSVSQGSQTRTMMYDGLRRLTSVLAPENAAVPGQPVAISYTYYDSGDLKTRQDGRFKVTVTYDNLNRVLGKEYTDPNTSPVTYVWDSVFPGQVTSMSNGVSTTSFGAYNKRGQPTKSTQTTGGEFSFRYKYNLAGFLNQITDPSGRIVDTGFDAAGRPNGLGVDGTSSIDANTSYVSSTTYASNGAPSFLSMGDNGGITETTVFSPLRQQPTSTTIVTPASSLTLTYMHCASGLDGAVTSNPDCQVNNGNVRGSTITSSVLPSSLTWQMGYDTLDRLASATETSGQVTYWSDTYSYDRYGNRAVMSTLPLNGATPTMLAQYSTLSNQIQIRPSGQAMPPDAYDKSGNLEDDPDVGTFTYDAENRLLSATVNGTTTTYGYDGEGRRVTKSGMAVTTYAYDAFGNLAAEYGGMDTSSCVTCYLLSDQLGSTRLVTDKSGAPQRWFDYRPFGEEIGPGIGGRTSSYGSNTYPRLPDVAAQKFTGKERDAETGLDYFGARYMSSAQGRFTSPDPYVFQFAAASHTPDDDEQKQLQQRYISNPQVWNKHTYGLNNPLKFVDPSGRCSKPSNQKEGETGICVEAFIAQSWFKLVGRGDDRGFSGTNKDLTARSRVKFTVSKDGKVSSEEVESARSGVVIKGLGLRGDTTAQVTAKPNEDGSVSVHVSLWGRNGEAFLAPIAPSGVLQGNFNLNISKSGDVTFVPNGSSATTFPSWGVYGYGPNGGVQTVKEIPEHKIGDLQKPPSPIR